MKKNYKVLKLTCLACDVISFLSLCISMIYTIKFFTVGTHEFEMLLMILVSIMFESVKILLVISKTKSILKILIMYLFILISITFTMNSFLNKIDIEKQSTKEINPLYTKNEEKIKIKKNEINTIEENIKLENKNKMEAVSGLSKLMATKRNETAEKYQKIINQKENQLKVVKSELDQLINNDIEKYVYKENSGNINTKVLDFIFGNDIKQKTKNLIISVFIALLIDFTHLTLTLVKRGLKKELEIIEIEIKNEIMKIENENEKIKKEAKKEEMLKEILNNPIVTRESKTNIVNLNKGKKIKLSTLANEIWNITIDNDNIVPSYRELAEKLNVSLSVIQRRVKELKDNGIIEKVENTKTLKIVEKNRSEVIVNE